MSRLAGSGVTATALTSDVVTSVNVNLPTTLAIARGMFIRPDNLDILLEKDQSSQNVRAFSTS